MLETVKEAIADLPDETFSEFYQKYIADLEDAIIAYDISKASSTLQSIEDVPDIIKIINKLTEELQ